MHPSIRNDLAKKLFLTLNRLARWLFGAWFALCLIPAPVSGDIEFWHIETEVRANTIRFLTQAFEAETGLGPISVIRVPEDEFRNRYSEAVRSGRAPALALADLEQIASVDYEHGLDHTATSHVIRTVGPDRFSEQALVNVRDAGKAESWFAIPVYAWVQGLWYRKDWFDREGLEPPATWDAIEKAAVRFHKPEDGQFGLIMGTAGDVYAEQVFSQLALSNGAELVNRQGAVHLDSPGMVETAEFYKRLARYTPTGPTVAMDYPLYTQGKVAMVFFSSYFMEDVFTALDAILADGAGDADPTLPNKTGVVTTISQSRPARFGALRVLGLSNQSSARDQETARSFARFLLREDAYVAFLHSAPGGMLPIKRRVGNSEIFLNDPQGIFRRFQSSTLRRLNLEGKFIETFSIRPDGFNPSAAAIVGARLLPPALKSVLDGQPTKQALGAAQQRALELLNDQ